jgi:hypothetical protein
VNAGAGLNFKARQLGLFLESRFHDVINGRDPKDLQFNNFTLGLRVGM